MEPCKTPSLNDCIGGGAQLAMTGQVVPVAVFQHVFALMLISLLLFLLFLNNSRCTDLYTYLHICDNLHTYLHICDN